MSTTQVKPKAKPSAFMTFRVPQGFLDRLQRAQRHLAFRDDRSYAQHEVLAEALKVLEVELYEKARGV